MKNSRFFLLVILLTLLVSTSVSHGDETESVVAQNKMEQFKANHPQAKFFGKQLSDSEGYFEEEATSNYVYGAPMSKGKTPIESAWNFYRQIEGIYAEEAGTLVSGSQQGVMWEPVTKTHKFTTFRFQQTLNGIPVYRSGVGFLVRNEKDFPVVMCSNNLKEMKGIDVGDGAKVVVARAGNLETAGTVKATDAMIANAAKVMNQAGPVLGVPREDSILEIGAQLGLIPLPVETSDEQTVIFAGVTNERVEPELAIVFTATRGSTKDMSQFQKQLIVAAVDDGEVLYSENMLHGDVSGTVFGRATTGGRAQECAPEAVFRLPYGQVREVGTTNFTFADADGNYTLPTLSNGTLQIRSLLSGRYFSVSDESVADGSTPSVTWNVFAGGTRSFLHNPNDTEFPTASVNAYLHANIVRDFVLSFEPEFPTIGTQRSFPILTNQTVIQSFIPITSCNAVYTGESIVFMRNLGLCNNTAIADVVYHEYGHHLVEVTGNGQGQFGEGSSDAIGVLIEDHPILGRGFFEDDCDGGIRSANAFRSYPCGSDFIDVHDCGQLMSGVVWDTLNEIRAVDPVNARDITTRLFLGMLIVRGNMGGGRMIGPEVPNIFVMLDDDDAFTSNGTPHIEQLAAAFNPHNLTINLPGATELTINGTSQADDIVVYQVGNQIIVNVNDDPPETHNLSDVSRIAIFGFGGADNIDVDAAVRTFISGGAGPDTIFGGSLANEILGGPGPDTIFGGRLADNISGGGGQDMIFGGPGNDIIFGNDAPDILFGEGGADEIFGGLGADEIYGGAGRDDLHGEPGSDMLFGGADTDFIFGDAGNDLLNGGGGSSDFLFGNDDNDTFFGGPGQDFFSGGNGIDTGLDAGEFESSIENSMLEEE